MHEEQNKENDDGWKQRSLIDEGELGTGATVAGVMKQEQANIATAQGHETDE